MSKARAGWGWLAVVVVLSGFLLLPRAVIAEADFAVPPALKPQVDFWIGIFATYGKRQVVIHDSERLDRIYSVVDFSDLDQEGLSEVEIELAMKDEEEAEKERVRSLLRRLDTLDPRVDALTEEEQRIVALFADDRTAGKFGAAASEDRLRGQRGVRERFARGIQTAHAYFPTMERIFSEEGVPVEITRLPLVESCFNMHAYSKVGAVGVWQFMPATARNYMRVNGTVDERLDPIAATHAAARFMRDNYQRLGTWPLAIKAYNHGPAGIARAVREVGTTDPATIIENYKGPAYKFASRNFYPEFLAALQVERNYRRYFGDLVLDPPLQIDTVAVPTSTTITTAARCAGTDTWQLTSLNPSLLPIVHTGRAPIPSGYELRVPRGSGAQLRSCLASVPALPVQVVRRGLGARRTIERTAGGRRGAVRGSAKRRSVVHTVKQGQTLAQIATLYGCSIEQLRRGNKIKGDKLHAGQVLRIPVS